MARTSGFSGSACLCLLLSVYLAAAAMNLACVARTGFRTDKISAALHLKPDEVVIAAQSLGFPAKSILDHLK